MIETWFDPKFKGRRHEPVFSALEALRTQQQDRLKMLQIYRLLYSDDEVNGYSDGVTRAVRGARSERSRFSENLIRSVVDTVCAKIGKNSPKPFVVSNGGDGALRRKAKNLNKFLLGKFDQLKANNVMRSILRAAAIEGTGAGKICIDYQTRDLTLERTPIHTLFVDQTEAQYASPSQLFQVMPANKDLLMRLYPKEAQAINSSAPPTYSTYARSKRQEILVEQVEVCEAWKLPDEPGKPGRHTICTSDATLVDEDWAENEFPFIWMHFSEPLSGFWGQGLAHLLMEIQYRVNYTLLAIQENIRLCGRPTWLVAQTANVMPSHIRNVAGNILTYKTTPPQLVNFQTTNPEVFQWLQDQRSRAFEIAGISQMSAESKKPTGDISGVALDTLNDIESERFIMFGKAYEQASIDLAEKLISLTKREYENGDAETQQGMFKSFYSRSWELAEVKWKDVDMHRDQFNLGVFPISSLPQSIAGRQQKIQEFMQQGIIDAETGRELLDFPDYQRWADLQGASKDNAERLVEDVLYEGKDHVVEKYHNVAYMLQYAQNLYNQQQLIDGDEEKLERLRQLMDQCQDLLDQTAQAQQAQAATQQAAAQPAQPQVPPQ